MVDHRDAEFKKLMTWQVLMQDKMDQSRDEAERERKRLNALSEKTDERISTLVTAIGKLIERLPKG